MSLPLLVAASVAVVSCGATDTGGVERDSRVAEREVIDLALRSAEFVSIPRVSYTCDESNAAGGSLIVNADGTAVGPAIVQTIRAEASTSGWTIEDNDDHLVLRKSIGDRTFRVVVPGGGSTVEPNDDRVVVAWDLDRADC